MKIAIVGSGYVGLVTGTCFAEVGIDTVCVDIDVEKIEKMFEMKEDLTNKYNDYLKREEEYIKFEKQRRSFYNKQYF